MANPLLELAKRVRNLERNQLALGSGSQLSNSAIEDGSLAAYVDESQTMQIGLQWDGTSAPTVVNGPTPPTPVAPSIVDGTEAVTIVWNGLFVDQAIVPMDFLRVDVYIGTTPSFFPSPSNRVGSIVSPSGGQVVVPVPPGTWYARALCWALSGSGSGWSAASPAGDSWPIIPSTDGFAPSSSPTVELIGGMDILLARWTPITNFDPVEYEVHVSATSGFNPDSTTLVGTTSASQFTIKALPGLPPPDPNTPDPRKLQYGVDYYVRTVARDADGSAAAGVQGTARIFQVTGVNLSADSVTAANVVAGTLTGDLFSASVVIAGAFRTAETGQRVEMTPLGLFAYRADGSIMLKIPTDSPDALFDGEFVMRGATVLGGMSIQSLENEITADAALTLMRGIAAPTASPQLQTTYDTLQPSTATLTAAQKTNNDPSWGIGGPFDLAASQVSCIEWRASFSGHFAITQVRPNGSRVWYFDNTGAPKQILGTYFNDFKDWEIWSTQEITTSSNPAKNGVYAIFRFLAGAGTDYWLSSPLGMNSYVRQNTTQPPCLATNGSDIAIAEAITGGILRIRYFSPPGGGTPMPAPSTTYESGQGYSTGRALCYVQWSPVGFDRGAGRYATAERNTGLDARLLQWNGLTGAGVLTPGGSGGWLAANKEAESWECPASTRRAMCWDGTNFWTYGSDGFMYKHTSEVWDKNNAATSSVWWAKLAFSDTDAAGTGTHTTAAGVAKSFTAKRRASMKWTPPTVPDNGGVDDPNIADLYMARGATLPANSSFHLQASALTPTTFTTLATVTATPPTVSTFPNTNPALIRNDDDTLRIDATGLIRAGSGLLYAGSFQIVENPPYWYGYLNASVNIVNATFATLTGWQGDTIAGHGVNGTVDGISAASGVYTINKAGMYRVAGQVYWAQMASPAGRRLFQSVRQAGGSQVIQSHDVTPYASAPVVNQLDKEFRFNVGDSVRFQVYHTQNGGTAGAGSPISLTGSNTDISWIQLRWIGP